MSSSARTRTAAEDGFGMVELLVAMTVLAVGIMVVFGMFNAGTLTIRRAATVSTAATLADSEMEKIRAVKFDVIGLLSDGGNGVAGADATYTADAAYRPASSPVNQTGSAVIVTSSNLVATKNATGPDGKTYRVDTYITWQQVAAVNGASGRDVKLVTIVVRDQSGSTTWTRISSSFDAATG